MTLTPGLFSGGASGLLSARAETGTVLDSDFLVVTVAFNCADNGVASGFTLCVVSAGVFVSDPADTFTETFGATLTLRVAGVLPRGLLAVLTVPAFCPVTADVDFAFSETLFLLPDSVADFAARGLHEPPLLLSAGRAPGFKNFFIAFAVVNYHRRKRQLPGRSAA